MLDFDNATYFRHTDGGYYIRMHQPTAMHTDTKEELVIYAHLFPFHERLYARPASEWTPERFTPVTPEEFLEFAATTDRILYQHEVTANRNARRAKAE